MEVNAKSVFSCVLSDGQKQGLSPEILEEETTKEIEDTLDKLASLYPRAKSYGLFADFLGIELTDCLIHAESYELVCRHYFAPDDDPAQRKLDQLIDCTSGECSGTTLKHYQHLIVKSIQALEYNELSHLTNGPLINELFRVRDIYEDFQMRTHRHHNKGTMRQFYVCMDVWSVYNKKALVNSQVPFPTDEIRSFLAHLTRRFGTFKQTPVTDEGLRSLCTHLKYLAEHLQSCYCASMIELKNSC